MKDLKRHDPGPPRFTPAQLEAMARRPHGLSFEAEPTGLGATTDPASLPGDGEGYVERFSRSQAQITSRPGFTPGPPEFARPHSPFKPRGITAIVFLLAIGLLLMALVAFTVLG